MNRLIFLIVSTFIVLPTVFAGESGYEWFDLNTCSTGSVSTDDYAEKNEKKCIDFLHECPRRLNSDPSCRSNIDPGRVAAF